MRKLFVLSLLTLVVYAIVFASMAFAPMCFDSGETGAKDAIHVDCIAMNGMEYPSDDEIYQLNNAGITGFVLADQ